MTSKEKIIQAGYAEFGGKSFSEASTNKIVEDAGVSKGVLFYYFNSKKELYRHLIKISMEYYITEYNKVCDYFGADLIDRYYGLSKLKLNAFHRQPELSYFIMNVYLRDINDPEVSEIIKEEFSVRDSLRRKFYKDLDTSKLRSDIPHEDSLRMLKWMMDGYEDEIVNKLKKDDPAAIDLQPYFDEFDRFVEHLKTVFYK